MAALQKLTEALSKIPNDTPAELRTWAKTAEADAPRMGIFGNDAGMVRVIWDLRIDAVAASEARTSAEG